MIIKDDWPACMFCVHFSQDQRTCVAFPGGIPLIVILGENKHESPLPGDNGIQFEPLGEMG